MQQMQRLFYPYSNFGLLKKNHPVMWPHHDNVIIIKCKKSTILIAFTAK